MKRVNKIAVILMLSLLLPVESGLAAKKRTVSDIRVLIDVSGSMKENDPDNLRSPALRMLAGVMPRNAKAGVWTFARFVNMLVPWRSMDDSWRQQAESQSTQIHSYGLFTDIEQVLNKSTVTALKADPAVRKSLILLSDGFVDLQAGDKATQASRQRIIDELIPKLKQANITVHTIALSDNADHELLKHLSFVTDGWYQRADSSDDLQRLFLHMFEKAAQRDSLPLSENHFSVDKSVEEMTVLAFRSKEDEQTRLILPDGSILTPADVSETLRWLHEYSYDLITIKNPQTGNWMIDAELDPDNRVMVVTDMQLHTSDLPNNVLAGEKLDFEAMLTEKGEAIKRSDFLEFVSAGLQQFSSEDKKIISMDRSADNHVFKAVITDLPAGTNDMIVTLTSETFQRERRQKINVVPMPFTIEQQQLELAARSHRITIQSHTGLIEPASVTISSLLQADDGSEWPYELSRQGDNLWQLTLADLNPQQNYELSMQIRAKTQKGRPILLQPDVIKLTDTAAAIEQAIENTSTGSGQSADIEAFKQEQTGNMEKETMESFEDLDMADQFVQENDGLETDSAASGIDITLVVGNLIIATLLIAGIVWWRRQSKMMMQAVDHYS